MHSVLIDGTVLASVLKGVSNGKAGVAGFHFGSSELSVILYIFLGRMKTFMVSFSIGSEIEVKTSTM